MKTAEARSYWLCGNCGGRMIGFGGLQYRIGEEGRQQLWRLSGQAEPKGRPCPSCTRPLSSVLHETTPLPIELDVCRPCHILWMDDGEDARLSPVKDVRARVHKSPEQMRDYAEALATLARQQQETHQRAAESGAISKQGPDEAWKWIPALVGLPIEYNKQNLITRPHITWLIGLLVVFAFLRSWMSPDFAETLKAYGFISETPFRELGRTWVTSFFMHAGWLHLLGNMYFFLIFADDIEDELGGLSLISLLLGSHLTGVMAQWLVTGPSPIPLVGASAGVFGVLAYYMVRFPRVRIAYLYLFFFRPYWLRISARWLLLAKVAWELVLIWVLKGKSPVAHAAHAGGALFGILAALYVTHIQEEPMQDRDS